MSLSATLTYAAARLSPRERVLLGVSVALLAIIGIFYGIAQPGFSGARSAAHRNALAASDLAEAQALAAAVGKQQAALPGETNRLDRLTQSAAEHGLSVTAASRTPDALSLQLEASSSVSALTWAATSGVPIRSIVISRRDGGVVVDAAFEATTP